MAKRFNPLRVDPTRTNTLRRRMILDLRKMFARLRIAIRKLLVDDDVFGLTPNPPNPLLSVNAVINTDQRWRFNTTPEKLAKFKEWLASEVDHQILSQQNNNLMKSYIEEGLKKGAGRSFDDVNRSSLALKDQENLGFAQGTRDEFLRNSFRQPVAQEKLELLASRTFNELTGVTDAMSTQITRSLTDGLVQGKGADAIARDIDNKVDGIGRARAETIARTEIVRAHAEGQLLAMEQLGVKQVGVAAEWSTANDDAVCDLCGPLEGVVLTIDEAKGLLPRHANCVVGESIVLADDVIAIMKTHYTGEIVEITTAMGCNISVTLNHILLTQYGFLRAKDIEEGVHLIDASSFKPSITTPDDHRRVSCISDVFASLSKSSGMLSATVPLAPKNLHSDGISCDQKINVIWPDSKLRDDRNITNISVKISLKPTSGFNLEGALPTQSTTAEFLKSVAFTCDHSMGRRRDTLTLLSRRLLHSHKHRLTTISRLQSSLLQSSVNSSPTTLEPLSKSICTHPIEKQLDNLLRREGKSIIYDRVTSIILRHVKNLPVYDIQTQSTLYSLDGVISSNCRCAWIPANVGEDDANQKDTKGEIQDAIKSSIAEEGGKSETSWLGADTKIAKDRPESILPQKGTSEADRGKVQSGTDKQAGTDARRLVNDIQLGGYTDDKADLLRDTFDRLSDSQSATLLKRYGIDKALGRDEGQVQLIEYLKAFQGGGIPSTVPQPITMPVTTPVVPTQLFPGDDVSRETIRERLKGIPPSQHDKVITDILNQVAIDSGDVQEHGMSTPEPMKVAYIGGVIFKWSEKAVDVPGSVKDLVFADLPPALWKANSFIILSSQRNRDDHYWEQTYGMKDFKSAATGGDGKIVVYNEKLTKDILSHESGHNLATKVWGSTTPDLQSAYALAQMVEKPVTSYGANSTAEDFAEACSLFSRGGTAKMRFERDFPEKAKALKEILEAHK